MFKVTHNAMDYYMGFQVHQNHSTHSNFINQAHYIVGVVKWFNLDAANMIFTQADPHV